MGIREKLNDNPILTAAITGLLILASLAFIIYQLRGPDHRFKAPTKLYFTVDDGATFFEDDIQKLPPYDHNGQMAHRAHVFSCDGKKTTFVGYLERYAEPLRKKLAEARAASNMPTLPPEMMDDAMLGGLEYKKPGAGNPWIKSNDPKYETAVRITCPDGTMNNLMEVFP